MNKKSKILIFIILFVLVVNQNNSFNNNNSLQTIQEPNIINEEEYIPQSSEYLPNETESSTDSLTMVKIKEVICTEPLVAFDYYFQARSDSPSGATIHLYIDDVSQSIGISGDVGTYTICSGSIIDSYPVGTKFQIYARTWSTGTSRAWVINFRITTTRTPKITLSSMNDIFTLENTYVETHDAVSGVWTEYLDYEDIVVYDTEYKIRIYEDDTDILLFEDATYQTISTDERNIQINCIKLTNNANEPVIFKFTGTNPLNQQINPFDSLVIFYDDYTSYTVEDLYGNVVDTGGSVDSENELIYTPPYTDNVFLKYIDQNELTLDFNNFRTEIDFGDGYIPILNQIFTAERNSTINISVYNLDSNLLTNDSLLISPGLNYKNITIPVVYIENNANEQITAFLFNESSEPTDFYTYSYLDSDYESYENSSYIENFDSNSFQDTTISFENNSNNCPSLSVAYKNQVDIGENNTFNIYPIKTVNDISIVKIWNNITLINETLTESSGYYTKIFNSSYSHYYSVEIYIEDTSGYYNIMKIDNIFVLKNRIRINLENLQNKYVQYTSLNVSASLYEFDGTLITGSVNFTLKYPNGTIIKEDETPYLEYNFGYTCDYYTLIAEYFGDLDNLAYSVETIFEVITPPGQSYQPIFFDEDPVFNITISPYTSEFHNMTSFTDENLYIMYFDIYNNELHSEVFNFSTTNTLDYTPEMLKQCRIILANQFNNLLIFENYHVYVNSEPMLSNLFYRTVDSTLNITVYDLFGNLLYEDDYVVEREDNFIDLTLDQFSLKILNQLQDSTILNITNEINPLDFMFSEHFAINELLTMYVGEGDYSIYYIDDSGIEHTLNLNIDQSRLIILNTTHHEVYFSFFDLSGLGLNSETARFYLDGKIKDLGYNLIKGDTTSIVVRDFFNETLYSEKISLIGLTEYNIYLPIYTMLINNNFSTSMELVITRIGIDVEFKLIVPAQYGIPIRLLANVQYGMHMYYTNGTLAESKTILFDEDYEQISFGMFEKTYLLSDLTTSGISSSDFIIAIVIISASAISMFYRINKTETINVDKIKKRIYKQKEYLTGQSNPLKSIRKRDG